MNENLLSSDVARRFSLRGRTAVVVGGTRGIGRAIAETFAGAGADLAVVGRTAESLDEAVADLGTRGGRVYGIRADVSDAADRQRIIPEALEKLGSVNILVNNAGAKPPLKSDLLEREGDVLAGLWEVNVQAYLELSVAAARLMKADNWGRIINVSSSTALKARRGSAEYGITKAAELMLSRSLAVELGESNITVNALVPILTRTGFSAGMLTNDAQVGMILGMQAIKRIAEPDDISGAALLFASDAGSFITGTALAIDGGAHA